MTTSFTLDGRTSSRWWCEQCRTRVFTDRNLRGACASVGIEHAKTTDEMMDDYLQQWHNRDHQ